MKKPLIVSLLILLSFNLTAKEKQKTTELHWGINLEPLEYFEIAAMRFKNNVETRTNGQVKVKLSIGDYKQDDRDHLKDVQTRKYDMGQEVVNLMVDKEPSLGVWELPYLFESDEHVFKYTKSDFAIQALKNLEKHGVVAFDYTYSGGFMHMVGEKLNDFSGLRGELLLTEYSTEDYLQSIEKVFKLKGTEDYGDKKYPMVNYNHEIVSSVLEEVYKQYQDRKVYLNETRHRVFARILFINKDFLEKLTPLQQKVVIEEGQRAARFERDLSLEASNFHLENIINNHKNITFVPWSKEHRISQRKLFQKYYDQFDKKFGKGTTKKIMNMMNQREIASK